MWRPSGALAGRRSCCSTADPAPATTTSSRSPTSRPPAGGSIFYDQQGCGNSDDIGDPTLCTVDLYVREVDAVRDALGLDRVHILGQSWGGMLLMEYLVRQPAGVVSATIASSPASMPLWIEETARQRAALPPDVVAIMERHEAAGTWDDPEYTAAVDVFNERHLCRVVPFPEPIARSFAKLAHDPTVYRTMNGPNEFHVVGTLKDWDIIPRLGSIEGPVLLTSGRHDEATPRQMEVIADRIPQAEWVDLRAVGPLRPCRGAGPVHGRARRLPRAGRGGVGGHALLGRWRAEGRGPRPAAERRRGIAHRSARARVTRDR